MHVLDVCSMHCTDSTVSRIRENASSHFGHAILIHSFDLLQYRTVSTVVDWFRIFRCRQNRTWPSWDNSTTHGHAAREHFVKETCSCALRRDSPQIGDAIRPSSHTSPSTVFLLDFWTMEQTPQTQAQATALQYYNLVPYSCSQEPSKIATGLSGTTPTV